MGYPAFEAEFSGEVQPDKVDNEMAGSLIRLLHGGEYPYARFLASYRADDGTVTVKFEVDVERAQKAVVPIARQEVIAARFKNKNQPNVYALRSDFPTDLPHLNLADKDTPPWICLDERPWDEIKSRWTAFGLVERIRWWLAATATGNLHGDAQPAEPIFGSSTSLIVPSDVLLADWDASRTLAVCAVNYSTEPNAIVMREGTSQARVADSFVPIFITTQPLPMQRSRFAPANIDQLHDMASAWGVDLIKTLRGFVSDLLSSDPQKLSCRALLLLHIPLLNADGSSTGQSDLKAFCTLAEYDLAKIGVELGVFFEAPGNKGRVARRIVPDPSLHGENVPIVVLAVNADYSREVAAMAAGLPVDKRLVSLIGAGAIGSHLVETLRRDGFGIWSIIDYDTFLPHNVQRHRLAATLVSAPKASAMVDHLDVMIGAKGETTSICANVLGDNSEVNSNLQKAELVIDASASIPVGRWLSDLNEITARRLSVFFNPTGSDVVLLAEASNRSVPLAALEAQYYRAILEKPSLAEHLSKKADGYQYAGSCRSVSFKMPEHQVSMLSGAIAGEVRRHISGENVTVVVWAGTPETGLKREEVQVHPIDRHVLGDWEVVIDRGLIEAAAGLRARALPSETGGILLGTMDVPRREICIVQVVPAPIDSTGSPNGFDRGVKNLRLVVEEAQKKTAGQVEYVGEWHSHPIGAAPTPSKTDIKQLLWLGDERMIEELPAVMMIIGDDKRYTIQMVVANTTRKNGKNKKP